MVSDILNIIRNKQSLTREQAANLMNAILKGELSEIKISAILTGLAVKGETIDEIAGFASVMRSFAVNTSIDDFDLIDTCGTGGDGLNTFNISTTAAIVAAAAGVKIAKHGNRSISSKSGSADLLNALGIKIELSHENIIRSLKENGIAFLFAPIMHSAMKNVMPVRKELAIKTVFNYLGPLTNPSRAKKQVIGVSDEKLLKIYPLVLKEMGHKKAYVIRGEDGLDEASVSAKTKVVYLNNSEIKEFIIQPEDFGLEKHSIEDIKGDDKEKNALITRNILNNKSSKACKDIVIMNSAFAIHLAELADNLKEAAEIARKTIEDGKAAEFLNKWVEWNKNLD